MASSYTRRINLYINGKEVKNDIASIRGEMNRLVNAQSRMEIGSREYIAQMQKIKSLKTGSARPELLKNKEALLAVTQEAIILSNAAKIKLQPAIEGLTMVMNQYNVSASEARWIINVLGAGSKAGAGEIPYLTVGFEKAGTTAKLAGLSIETLTATLETLAPRFSQPEIAGRGLRGMLLRLQVGADDTNPKIVGMGTALENLGKKMLSPKEMLETFGLENIAVAQTLVTNVQELKNYEKAVTGTNVAIEQAAINTDNNNSKLAQAKNRLNVMSIELGEKLAPALQISTSSLSYFIKGMSVLIDFIGRNKTVILTLIYSITAYTVATKLATMWEARLNKEKLINIVIGKLQAWAYNAQFAAIALYNAGVALLSGNLAVATIQFRAFSAAMAANPIGLIVGLLVAAGTAMYYYYSGQMTAAQKAQKVMNDVNLEAQKNIVEEKIKLGSLLDIARNEKLSKEDRLNALNQLIAISPKYLGSLTLETINTEGATSAVKEYINTLLQKAKVQAASEKLIEVEKELLDLAAGNGADVSFWQQVGNGILSFGNTAVMAGRNAATAVSNMTEKQTELNLQKEKLLKITQKQLIEDAKNPGAVDGTDISRDLVREQELLLEQANKMPRSTEVEITARNKNIESIQKEIEWLNQLGTAKEGIADGAGGANSDAVKKRIAAAEAAHNAEMAAIKKRNLEGLTSDDQYKGELLIQEIKFLNDKMKIYKKGSMEYEQAYAESLGKQVEAEKTVKDLLEKAQKELADAKEGNLKDGIDKQKAIEENRWADELAGLKKQLLDKKDLSDQELALNDTINKTIEEKEAAHQKAMKDLSSAAEMQKLMDAALIREAKSATDQEYFAAQRDLAQAQYQQDLIDANENAAKIATAERSLSDKLIQIKLDELSRKQEINDAVFSAGSSYRPGSF